MRSMVVVACKLAATVPAMASGGLGCNAEDQSVKLLIESGVTRGMGSPIFNFRARLEILGKNVAEDLRKIEFSQEHVAQYWLDAQSLKLLLYRERDAGKPHGLVELTIDTRADDEGSYVGPYRLTVFDTAGDTTGEGKTVNLEGKADCFAE
jgi:hypothetical protein